MHNELNTKKCIKNICWKTSSRQYFIYFRKTRSIWAAWNKWSRKNNNHKDVTWNY